MQRTALATLIALAPPFAVALDPACAPLVASSEARIVASAWQATSRLDDFETEVIKTEEGFFMKNGDAWLASPVNVDDAERKTIESVKAGAVKVSGCSDGGEEVVDGVRTRVLIYTIEVPGSGIPPAVTRLNIGVSDGLPYQSSTAGQLSSTAGETRQKVTYRYTGVKAPPIR